MKMEFIKNTELIKEKDLLKYKDELNKVAPLDKKIYNPREAAKYFGCTASQIKGYISNYKQYFNDSVKVTGDPGKQTTNINEDAMFLLAILLCNKSSIGKQVTKNVINLLEASKQVKDNNKKEESEQLKINLKEKNKNTVKIEKMLIKNGKVMEEEHFEMPLDNFNVDKLLDKFLEDKSTAETKKETHEESIEKIMKDIIKLKAEKENNKKLLKTLEENNEAIYQYLNKCRLLGLEELESTILIQESFIFNKDIDAQILNRLYEKKKKEVSRKRGVLKESIELLATEKFNGETQDTYHYLSNELRFCMGINMKKIREKQKISRINPTSYLDMIINEDAFEDAMNIISTLLAE